MRAQACGPRRLEELSEARQGVLSKVKAAERDRDGLEGAKTVAEAYLGKERECAVAHASLYQIFLRDGQVVLADSARQREYLHCTPPCSQRALRVTCRRVLRPMRSCTGCVPC